MEQLSAPAARFILHYDPDRIDYAVTQAELQQLAGAWHTAWENSCLAGISIFFTTALNAAGAVASQETFEPTLSVFLNCLIAGVALFASIAAGCGWRKTVLARRLLLEQIRTRPGFLLKPGSFDDAAASDRLSDPRAAG